MRASSRLLRTVRPAVLAFVVVLAQLPAGGASADPDPAHILTAVMADADANGSADRIVLTYSQPVNHVGDPDGDQAFEVAGYTVASTDPVDSDTTLIIHLTEQGPDPLAAPAVVYTRAGDQPVTGADGEEALSERFLATVALDADGDGSIDDDCDPEDADVHPGAVDVPDLGFLDSDCDGIDGTASGAIFASPTGSDAHPGTPDEPKATLSAAIAAAAAQGKDVYAAAGTYPSISLVSNVSIYGGYSAAGWQRGTGNVTTVTGTPQAIFANAVTDVTIQMVSAFGALGSGPSVYGIRAINGAQLTLQKVNVSAASAAPGSHGGSGPDGKTGANGSNGQPGSCDGAHGNGGAPGQSPGFVGGAGGRGGLEGSNNGVAGANGTGPAPGTGGAGGSGGNPGRAGGHGTVGGNGAPGSIGSGGSASISNAGAAWMAVNATNGSEGAPGSGGGGGGGGGGQGGTFVNNGGGNGGGGGGAGGGGGRAGQAGTPGGGSFGVYLFDSQATVIHGSAVLSSDGGRGGDGGGGGSGAGGGNGGAGATTCTGEVGAGGNGGRGGAGGKGGAGGGGAGGPSVAVFRAGTSSAAIDCASTLSPGTPGVGGTSPAGGSANGATGLSGHVVPAGSVKMPCPVDTIAPVTRIVSAPPLHSASSTAIVRFDASEDGSSFVCSLDGGPSGACTSPVVHTGLDDGPHTFAVRATDSAGNADPDPAAITWTVDTIAPTTSIDAGPPALIVTDEASFEFSADEDATFRCSLDSGPYIPCPAQHTISGLAAGPHTLHVRARDLAGNIDAAPPVWAWQVRGRAVALDVTPAASTIDAGGSQAYGAVATDAFGVTWDATDEATFSLSPDGGCDANVCTATVSGPHVVSVTYQDAAEDASLEVLPLAPASVEVTAEPAIVKTFVPAADRHLSTLTIHVTDQYGNGVADGTEVAVAITQSASGAGTLPAPLGPALDAETVATEAGTATVSYSAGVLPGTDEVTATVGTLTATSTIQVDLI